MRARLQRGGTEPSVTPLSLARVSSFSLAQEGNTPLIYAIQGEQGAVVEMLITAGARVNLADNVRRAAARSCRARALSLSRPARPRRALAPVARGERAGGPASARSGRPSAQKGGDGGLVLLVAAVAEADVVDWFVAELVLELLVGAVPQQELDDFELAVVCCSVQRSGPVLHAARAKVVGDARGAERERGGSSLSDVARREDRAARDARGPRASTARALSLSREREGGEREREGRERESARATRARGGATHVVREIHVHPGREEELGDGDVSLPCCDDQRGTPVLRGSER